MAEADAAFGSPPRTSHASDPMDTFPLAAGNRTPTRLSGPSHDWSDEEAACPNTPEPAPPTPSATDHLQGSLHHQPAC